MFNVRHFLQDRSELCLTVDIYEFAVDLIAVWRSFRVFDVESFERKRV